MFEKPGSSILKSNVPQHWIGRVFFATRAVSPGQKWWPSLLGREISWEGPSMHSRCLAFFPFMFWGLGRGRGERFFFSIFPSFPLRFHYVPFKFPICSSILQCFSQRVLHTTSLWSHMHWKMVFSFHLYRWAKGEELYTSK